MVVRFIMNGSRVLCSACSGFDQQTLIKHHGKFLKIAGERLRKIRRTLVPSAITGLRYSLMRPDQSWRNLSIGKQGLKISPSFLMNGIFLRRITDAETKFREWVRRFTIAIGSILA